MAEERPQKRHRADTKTDGTSSESKATPVRAKLPAADPSAACHMVACVNEQEALFLHHQMWRVGGKGEYLQHPIEFDIEQDALVLDVGANIGLLGVRLRELFSSGAGNVSLHAWEPVPALLRCVKDNGTTNCHPYALGSSPIAGVEFTVLKHYSLLSGVDGHSLLSDESAAVMAQYLVSVARASSNTSHPIGVLAQTDPEAATRLAMDTVVKPMLQADTLQVQVRTLSSELDRLSLLCDDRQRAALLKIDVEGAEWDVLQGIEDRHWQRIDQVIIEVHHRGNRVKDVEDLLKAKGFSTIVTRENGPPLFLPFMLFGLTEPVPVESGFERLATVFARR